MEFLGDSDNVAAIDVVTFVKEVVERNLPLRKKIVHDLLGTLSEMKAGKVMRGALWVIGEYCFDVECIVPVREVILICSD